MEGKKMNGGKLLFLFVRMGRVLKKNQMDIKEAVIITLICLAVSALTITIELLLHHVQSIN
jgi:hypothetical protein